MAHSLIAQVSKTPEIALTEEEAKQMAQAAINVMAHYNIKASQKAIDWGNLVLSGAIIYSGKYLAIAARHKKEAEEARAERQKTAAPFGLEAR